MDVKEFKQKYPHLAHLEGDALWDAMTQAMLVKQGLEPTEDIVLSEEDEVLYQQYKKTNDESVVVPGTDYRVTTTDYSRKFWQDWDKPQPVSDKSLSTAKFMIFDVSNNDDPPPLTC